MCKQTIKREAPSLQPQQKTPENKTVSVIIPTYNRSAFLRRTLEQVLHQTYPAHEVIVIDQTQAHPPKIERYLASIQNLIRYELLSQPSVTRARNLGLQKARGEVILCLDDDVDLPDDFIWKHLRNYNDPDICAVAGRITDERKNGRFEPKRSGVITWYGRVISNFYTARRITVDHARGANFSFLRERALRCGGFDEQFAGNALREETDFCIRYLKAGPGRMVFDPEAALFHHIAPSGGCRVKNQGLDPLTYANELYFWLKHFGKCLLPYFLLNLFVRFFLVKSDTRKVNAWEEMRRKLKAMARGICLGIGLYRTHRRKQSRFQTE